MKVEKIILAAVLFNTFGAGYCAGRSMWGGVAYELFWVALFAFVGARTGTLKWR